MLVSAPTTPDAPRSAPVAAVAGRRSGMTTDWVLAGASRMNRAAALSQAGRVAAPAVEASTTIVTASPSDITGTRSARSGRPFRVTSTLRLPVPLLALRSTTRVVSPPPLRTPATGSGTAAWAAGGASSGPRNSAITAAPQRRPALIRPARPHPALVRPALVRPALVRP